MPTKRLPYVYYGGKSKVAEEVWSRFGLNIKNYIEPFLGGAAMLINRPEPFTGYETVNDANAYISNFWRCVKSRPDELAHWCDQPIHEVELHARHAWLLQQTDLPRKLLADLDYCDPKIGGYWCHGQNSWIGSGWCGKYAKQKPHLDNESGTNNIAKRPGLGRASGTSSVRRFGKKPKLSSANGTNALGKKPYVIHDLGTNALLGQKPQLFHGQGTNTLKNLTDYFAQLATRLCFVRVLCGDWTRVLTPAVVTSRKVQTAIFLDPPYTARTGRVADLYAHDSLTIADQAKEWAIKNASDKVRIAFCGMASEHVFPKEWHVWQWRRNTRYKGDEAIWFSP